MVADNTALTQASQLTDTATSLYVGDNVIDSAAKSIVNVYHDLGLHEAVRTIYNTIQSEFPVYSLSCTTKPYQALWAIKLTEYRENTSTCPEIYSLKSFLASQEVREEINNTKAPVQFTREHGEQFFEVLAPEAQSAITMSIAQGAIDDVYLNLAAPRGQQFKPAHVNFLYLLTRRFVDELRHDFIYHTPAQPDPIVARAPTQNASHLVRLCPCLKDISTQLQQVAPTDMLVLLTGETGVGKDVVARAIHENSVRCGKRFVKVNCGAIPDSLLDSELFGYEKGAFTGATTSKAGYFEQADGGTIFLDEIGELSLAAQVRLLHVLETGSIQRVGAQEEHLVNIRVIAATHKNLWEEVRRGTFREDLCYRLFVCYLEVPPLRTRKADLPPLIWYFLNKKSLLLQQSSKLSILQEEIQKLRHYSWPGNVRELEHTIERALLYSQKSSQLDIMKYTYNQMKNAPSAGITGDEVETDALWVSLEEYTANYIRKALLRTNGKVKGKDGAASLLKINSSTLRYRIKKYGLLHLMHPGI